VAAQQHQQSPICNRVQQPQQQQQGGNEFFALDENNTHYHFLDTLSLASDGIVFTGQNKGPNRGVRVFANATVMEGYSEKDARFFALNDDETYWVSHSSILPYRTKVVTEAVNLGFGSWSGPRRVHNNNNNNNNLYNNAIAIG